MSWRAASQVLFNVICALIGTAIVGGPRAWPLLLPAVALLALQCVCENRAPLVAIFRGTRASTEHDHVLTSHLVAPLAQSARCVWLHHDGHGLGRHLDGPARSMVGFATKCVLCAPVAAALLPEVGVVAFVITVVLSAAAAQTLDTMLTAHDDGLAVPWLLCFAVASCASVPSFSWAYGAGLVLGWLVGTIAHHIGHRRGAASDGRPGDVLEVRAARDLERVAEWIRFASPFRRVLGAAPRCLFEIRVENEGSVRWKNAVGTLLARTKVAVIDATALDVSPGVQWELSECRARRIPTLLTFDGFHRARACVAVSRALGRPLRDDAIGRQLDLDGWPVCVLGVGYDHDVDIFDTARSNAIVRRAVAELASTRSKRLGAGALALP